MDRAGRIALGAATLALTGLAIGAANLGRNTPAPPPAPPPAPVDPAPAAGSEAASPWIELDAAARRFVLGDNIFGREPAFYVARRHVAGGGRLDQLAFGSPAEAAPYLRLNVYRPLDEPVGGASFWLEMARRAGEAGLALERSPPRPGVFRTRLGVFEYGALKASGRFGPRECLGFRHQSGPGAKPGLVLSGLACFGEGAKDAALAREALICALEAINLAADDGDAELRAFFEGSDAPVCGSGRPAAGGDNS